MTPPARQLTLVSRSHPAAPSQQPQLQRSSGTPALPREAPLVSPETLRRLYQALLRTQLLVSHQARQNAAGDERDTGENAALLTGASVEIVAALCAYPGDHLLGAGDAARLVRGESFADILRRASVRSEDAPQSEQVRIPLDRLSAIRAFTGRLRGEEAVVFSLLKQWPAEAPFRRTLQACGQARLPVLFYVESEWTHFSALPANRPGSRQCDRRRLAHDEAQPSLDAESGIPTVSCDAHDAVALYRVTTEATYNARAGRGPTLIETVYVVDSAVRELTGEALAGGSARHRRNGITSPADPVRFLEDYMRARDLWDADWADQQRMQAQQELDAAAES